MNSIVIERQEFSVRELQQIHLLLDYCYPRPPKDVFYRFVRQYRGNMLNYLAVDGDVLAGIVQLAPNSKGGTLETLAVHPEYQGQGIAKELVEKLISSNPGVIQLTTRIPRFFQQFGFQQIVRLTDGSDFMLRSDSITPKDGDV